MEMAGTGEHWRRIGLVAGRCAMRWAGMLASKNRPGVGGECRFDPGTTLPVGVLPAGVRCFLQHNESEGRDDE
jgi:hypothetical protein